MTKLSLKSIIGKNKEGSALIREMLDPLRAVVWVEDEKGQLVFGNKSEAFEVEDPVLLENEIVGWVKGNENVMAISRLINYLVQKEWEKRKLGNEVLNLYTEVNLMFNFSDKIAQTMGAASIGRTALEEASRVIKSDSGVVLLWDESTKQLQIAASSEKYFFDFEKVNSQLPLLLKIIFSGQSEIIEDTSVLKEAGVLLPGVESVIYAALKVKHRVMGAIILASSESVLYTAADLKLLTTLALQSSSAIESALLYEKNIREAREKEESMRMVYEATGKFVPNEFIRSLGHDVITDVRLGDQIEKIVTILFSDIRDYTSMSEQMTPQENFNFICSFSEKIGPLIRKHNGFIHQYLGDAIMAIFPGNATDALNAAIEMQKTVELVNQHRRDIGQPLIQIGVGMHTGPLIMGVIGDEERLETATISDTVNTASRIESLTKYYKTGILISNATLQHIFHPKNFHLRHLGMVQLKGKLAPIGIHECFNGNAEPDLQRKLDSLPAFKEGMRYYLDKSFAKAISTFQQVVEKNPTDHTAKFFLNKAARLISSGVPEDWTGVEEMASK